MKTAMCLVLMFTVASVMNCFATDPPYSNSPGEVIFYTEESYVDPIVVSCTLSGVVFDHEAIWNVLVPSSHPGYNDYTHYGTSTKNNSLAGSVNELTHSTTYICWESIYETDDQAQPPNCTGMIGWGNYTFAVGNENEDPEVSFTLNTIDGRWMYSGDSNGPENKFIFRVVRGISGIEVYIYNQNTDSWDTITIGSNKTYWKNNANGSRYRDGLDPNSTMPFTLSNAQSYPVACDYAILDVPLACTASLLIGTGKTLQIHDYYDDYTSGYQNTVVRFESLTGIVVDFENDPNITTTLIITGHEINNLKTVVLASSDYAGSPNARDDPWNGIKANYMNTPGLSQPSSYYLYLKDCAIYNTITGIDAKLPDYNILEHHLELISCRIMYCITMGIRAWNSSLYVHNSAIYYAGAGILYVGYTFNHSCPNRIDSSTIGYSEMHGISIVNHKSNIDYYQTLGNPNRLELRGNHVQSNIKHGIAMFNSIAMLRENVLNANGKTNGIETPTEGYCGLWANQSQISFHRNQAIGNTAYGLQADNQSYVQGNYMNYSGAEEDSYGELQVSNPLLQGYNCFSWNDYNIGASNNYYPINDWDVTKIFLGTPLASGDPLPLDYIGDWNSFSTPTKTLPQSSDLGQMTAEQGSLIMAFRNYWGESTAYQETTNGDVQTDLNLLGIDDACDQWATQPSGGNYSPITLSDEAQIILTRVLLGFTDSAASLAYNTIDNSLDSVEIGIKMLALRSAYIYDKDIAARDTLRKYAFKPYNPGIQLEFITYSALVDLITAEILLDNTEGAVLAIDSILYRTVPKEIKAKYLANKAEILINRVGDSSYIAILDSLLSVYPGENSILAAKYLTTFDSTYTGFFPKSATNGDKSIIPVSSEVIAYPSPAFTEQILQIDGLAEVKNVVLFDYLGRSIDRSRYSYNRLDDRISFEYRLDDGVYIMVIVAEGDTMVKKVVVSKNASNFR
ncbi:MAG: T9SS type A sorting domain-containing protein [Bacteroidota bacterium]